MKGFPSGSGALIAPLTLAPVVRFPEDEALRAQRVRDAGEKS